MPRRKRFTRNLGRPTVEPLAPRRPDARYVRLEHPTEHFGLFSYVGEARRALDEEGRTELEALMSWFNEHLEEPSRMVPFRDVGKRAHTVAAGRRPPRICWFRGRRLST